jgi:hypothetical protein
MHFKLVRRALERRIAATASKPTITFAIATYNWSRALRCALRSALLQTMQDFEILVVGDGCTDDSAAVVAEFNDPRLRRHNLERNHGGQWAANNYACENAAADWIAYLGHDDIWYPTHLEAVLRTGPGSIIAGNMTGLLSPMDGFGLFSMTFVQTARRSTCSTSFISAAISPGCCASRHWSSTACRTSAIAPRRSSTCRRRHTIPPLPTSAACRNGTRESHSASIGDNPLLLWRIIRPPGKFLSGHARLDRTREGCKLAKFVDD